MHLPEGAVPDPWADQAATVATLLGSLAARTEQGPDSLLQEVLDLRRRRRDSAVALTVTEFALSAPLESLRAGLETALADLGDRSWLQRLALGLMGQAQIGVLSLGAATVGILEALADHTVRPVELVTDRVSVARGLGYLDLPVLIGDPSGAPRLLVPGVATFGTRIWTTSHIATVAGRVPPEAKSVVAVVHPFASLTPLARGEYRPPAVVVDIDLGSGRLAG